MFRSFYVHILKLPPDPQCICVVADVYLIRVRLSRNFLSSTGAICNHLRFKPRIYALHTDKFKHCTTPVVYTCTCGRLGVLPFTIFTITERYHLGIAQQELERNASQMTHNATLLRRRISHSRLVFIPQSLEIRISGALATLRGFAKLHQSGSRRLTRTRTDLLKYQVLRSMRKMTCSRQKDVHSKQQPNETKLISTIGTHKVSSKPLDDE